MVSHFKKTQRSVFKKNLISNAGKKLNVTLWSQMIMACIFLNTKQQRGVQGYIQKTK